MEDKRDRRQYYLDNKERCMTRQLEYVKTVEGYFTRTYAGQRSNSKHRKHVMPDYSKQDLIGKYEHTTQFKELFNNWVTSGYKKDLKPSFDRIDPKKPYTLDNIQLMTWEDNKLKGDLENPTVSVCQYTLDGTYINTFISIKLASAETGIHYTNIGMCSAGKRKTAGGFTWRYLSDLSILI